MIVHTLCSTYCVESKTSLFSESSKVTYLLYLLCRPPNYTTKCRPVNYKPRPAPQSTNDAAGPAHRQRCCSSVRVGVAVDPLPCPSCDLVPSPDPPPVRQCPRLALRQLRRHRPAPHCQSQGDADGAAAKPPWRKGERVASGGTRTCQIPSAERAARHGARVTDCSDT